MSSEIDESEALVLSGDRLATGRFGRHRVWSRLNIWERLFLVVSTLNILACIGLSIHRIVVASTNHEAFSADFTFSLLLILNSLFCLFYIMHGLLTERRFEIYMYILAASFVVIYCIVHFCVRRDFSAIKIGRLVVAVILGPISIALAVKVISGFGWYEFQILGASEELQGMYCTASWFSSLIKFDLQVALSFLILLVSDEGVVHTSDIVITCVGIPISIAWMYLGRMAMRRELKPVAILFGLIGLFAPVYVVVKIILRSIMLHRDGTVAITAVTASLLVVGALLLLVRLIVYIELVAVYRNFNRGLKERAFDSEANERTGLLAR